MNLTLRHCSTCGQERFFEQPRCVDGHGAECPERACVDCGSAIVIGLDLRLDLFLDVTAAGDTHPRAA